LPRRSARRSLFLDPVRKGRAGIDIRRAASPPFACCAGAQVVPPKGGGTTPAQLAGTQLPELARAGLRKFAQVSRADLRTSFIGLIPVSEDEKFERLAGALVAPLFAGEDAVADPGFQDRGDPAPVALFVGVARVLRGAGIELEPDRKRVSQPVRRNGRGP